MVVAWIRLGAMLVGEVVGFGIYFEEKILLYGRLMREKESRMTPRILA